MKALIVTVAYVLAGYLGRLDDPRFDAWAWAVYDSAKCLGLVAALFLAGVIPGRGKLVQWLLTLACYAAITAGWLWGHLWACWRWFRAAMLAGATCPRCASYRTVNRDDSRFCRSCGKKF